jgi:DNA-binding CsgD family transcriptional regulator
MTAAAETGDVQPSTPQTERAARVRVLAAQGRTDGQIAQTLGVSTRTVLRDRAQYGIQPAVPAGGNAHRSTELAEAVRRLNRAGLTDPQIADEIGVHRETVRTYRAVHGIPPAVPRGWAAARKARAEQQQRRAAEKTTGDAVPKRNAGDRIAPPTVPPGFRVGDWPPDSPEFRAASGVWAQAKRVAGGDVDKARLLARTALEALGLIGYSDE